MENNIAVAKILGNAAVIPSIFGKLESLCTSRLGFDITFTYTWSIFSRQMVILEVRLMFVDHNRSR